MTSAPSKVLFITGWGRSGTTLFDMMLGQIDGFFSAGEIRYVWDRGLLDGAPCGCQAPVRACPVWSRALGDYLTRPASELAAIVRDRDAFHTRELVLLRAARRARLAERVRPLATHLSAVRRGLVEATGARVIVDSSKFPSHGFLLGLDPGVELYVIHLVRDPRAVAFSWRKRKTYDVVDGRERLIHRHGLLKSTLYWLTWNRIAEQLWAGPGNGARYMRVRYEDWIAAPRATLGAVLDLVGEKDRLEFFRDEQTVALRPCHLVAGNPARFRTGDVRLVADEQWRRDMPAWSQALVGLASMPLRRRYGYA